MNRPHGTITFRRLLDGLEDFRKSYPGQYRLEVLLPGGITGLPVPVEKIAEIASRIGPDRIHLSTVVRPPAESYAVPVPRDFMECFAVAFGNDAEVIGAFRNLAHGGHAAGTLREVPALVSKRLSTLEDIAAGLGLGQSEASSRVERLSAAGLVEAEYQGRRLYFKSGRGR